VVGAAVFAAVETGWAGYGWADLKSRLYPGDDGLLAWVPADTEAVAIIDPHQIHAQALGAEKNAARQWLDRVRNDVKTASGVDLAFDVDKLAITPSLVVMSGRFSGEDLAARLADYKYVKAEHANRTYLVRAGEDAIMAPDDSHLLYGSEASIRAAIEAEGGASLAKNDLVVQRLARMGYKEPFVGTVTLSGERPSLRSMITGSAGPHAVTAGVQVRQGIDVAATIDTGSTASADELAHLLDEKRVGLADLLAGRTGADLATLVAKTAHDATIKATAGEVDLSCHVSSEALDALIQAAEKSGPLNEAYKDLRLYQLLVPGGGPSVPLPGAPDPGVPSFAIPTLGAPSASASGAAAAADAGNP
jgi:hypothetical protein